jgi:hypothetical protein
VGLDWPAVESIARLHGAPLDTELFARLRLLESAALELAAAPTTE